MYDNKSTKPRRREMETYYCKNLIQEVAQYHLKVDCSGRFNDSPKVKSNEE